MKKQKIEIIAMLILIVIILISIIYFITREKQKVVENNVDDIENIEKEEYVQVLDDETKYNTSAKLKEAKSINGLEISNIQLTDKNEQSVLLATITNRSGKATDIILINITLYDKEGNIITEIPGIISPMKINETSELIAGITTDYANAYDFKVSLR